MTNLKKLKPTSMSPPISLVITSYTMERFNDICELLDSIKAQTILTQPQAPSSQSKVLSPNSTHQAQPTRLDVRITIPQLPAGDHRPLDHGLSTIEVICVVERSQELYEKVKEYGERIELSGFKALFNEGELGLSAARNLGVLNASGDIVAFVDDDVLLFPSWAEELIRSFDDSSVIGVTGPALPLWENESMSWFPKEFYWIISCTAWFDSNEKKEVRNAWGHNMAFKREAFDVCLFFDSFGRTKGWHELGKRGPVGDDTEFCMNLRYRTGKKIIYRPELKQLHKVYAYRIVPRFIRRQAFWQGYTKAMFRKLYGGNEKVLSVEYCLLRRIILELMPNTLRLLVFHPKLAWKRLSLTAGVLFHLTLGYLSAILPPLKMVKRWYG